MTYPLPSSHQRDLLILNSLIVLFFHRICGGAVYDSRYYGCDVNDAVREKTSLQLLPDTCYNSESGDQYFNRQTHSCCDGHLIAANHTCCAESSECCVQGKLEGYNFNEYVCCGGLRKPKRDG